MMARRGPPSSGVRNRRGSLRFGNLGGPDQVDRSRGRGDLDARRCLGRHLILRRGQFFSPNGRFLPDSGRGQRGLEAFDRGPRYAPGSEPCVRDRRQLARNVEGTDQRAISHSQQGHAELLRRNSVQAPGVLKQPLPFERLDVDRHDNKGFAVLLDQWRQ
jgi:hypothetical protein